MGVRRESGQGVNLTIRCQERPVAISLNRKTADTDAFFRYRHHAATLQLALIIATDSIDLTGDLFRPNSLAFTE